MNTNMVIVAGQVTGNAQHWLESHGVVFEFDEAHSLAFLTLPTTADITTPARDSCVQEYHITFTGPGEDESKHEGILAIVIPALLSFETQVYLILD